MGHGTGSGNTDQPVNSLSVSPDSQIAFQFAQATTLSMVAIGMNGIIEFVNASAEGLFGYDGGEMIGQPISIIIPERFRGAHDGGLKRSSEGGKPNIVGKPVEVWALRKDGSEFPIEITLALWEDSEGMHAGATIKDITERRERDDRLNRLATTDSLTGLTNRNRFVDLVSFQLAQGRAFAIFLLDLDGFKEINDSHGHGTGDALLQAVAVRLPYLLPHGSTVARFGGDEFAVLLPEIAEPDSAETSANAMLGSFSAPFIIAGYPFHVSACIGYTVVAPGEKDAEEQIASADLALYRAKAGGRQTAVRYETWMRSETQALRELRDEIRRALRLGQLEVYYQPQVTLSERQVTGFEALIRWNHPEKGLLGPQAFLPAVEQSALALEIGWWTLDQACGQIARFRALTGQGIRVAVNMFSAQLRAPNLVTEVQSALARHAISPDLLELEVTETIALYDDGRSLAVISQLRQLGVRIAFDDFGTGYASLSSLQRYPLTTLKIDRSFIREMGMKRRDAAIVRGLVTMSADLGLDTVAEGIETLEQETMVRTFGCHIGQGYLYGRPMPADDAMALLGDWERTRLKAILSS